VPPPATTPAWQIESDDLRSFDRMPEFASFVLARAGLAFEIDVHQTLQDGKDLLALSLWLDRRGMYVVRVEDGWKGTTKPKGRGTSRRPPRSLALAELEAITHSRLLYIPGKPELARWKRALLVIGGYAQPTTVTLAPLPETAPSAASTVYDAVRRLAEIRQPGESFPLAASFVSRWGQMSECDARSGREWLRRNRFITLVGPADFGKPKPANLWTLSTQHSESPR